MRRTLAAVAITAVLATTAGCTPAGPAADPTSSPSGSPAATAQSDPSTGPEIPPAALLTADDVGPGYTAVEELQGDDHGSITMMMAYCGEVDYTQSGDHMVSSLSGSVYRDDEDYVVMRVMRYDGTWAQRHLDDLRATLPRCAQVPVMGDAGDTATLAVVDSDFAGDGSVLVREERGGQTQFHAVVRQGDVEAVLRIHVAATQSQARDIAIAAADRLCAASSSC